MSSSFAVSSSFVEPRPIRPLDSPPPLHSPAALSVPGPSPPSPSTPDPLLLSALSEPKSRSLLLSCEADLLSVLSAPSPSPSTAPSTSHSTSHSHSHTVREVSSFQRLLLTRLGRRWGFEVQVAQEAETTGEHKQRSTAAVGVGEEEKREAGLTGSTAGGEDSLTFTRTAQSRPPPELLSQLVKQAEAEDRHFRSRSPAGPLSASVTTSSPASLKIMQRASSTEPGAPSALRAGLGSAVGASGGTTDSDVDEEAAIRQREEEYERIRARIFADENDDDVWRSVSIRREGEQLLSEAGNMSAVGELALGEGGTDSSRLRDEAAKKKSMDLLARLDSAAVDDSRIKKVGSGVEAADMHLYNRRLYPATVKAMTPYSLPFYPSSSFQPSYPAMPPAALSQQQYYSPPQQYMPPQPLPQLSTAALHTHTADLTIQTTINKLRQQQASDSTITIASPSSTAALVSSRPSSASSVTSPTLSSSPVLPSLTILTQSQRAAGFVDVATLQQMNVNAPVFTPAYAKQHTTSHTPHYTNRGMAAMPAGMQFVSTQPAPTPLTQPLPAVSSLPYATIPYAVAVPSSSPQLPQGFRAVRPTNPSSVSYTRNIGGYYGSYTAQSAVPPGAPYQPLSGSAYGFQHHPYSQPQQPQQQQQQRASTVSPTSVGASEASQRTPLVDGGLYPMYINTFPSSNSLSPSSQSRPQPSSNSPSPIGPPSAAASSIRSRALSLPTSSDPILEQPLPSRRYSHAMDGNVASLSSLSLSSSSSPTVSSPSFSSANDPIVQPSTLAASSLSSPTSIQQQQKQHTLFSSPTASSSPFSPFSFQSSPFLSSSSSDQVTGAPLFSLTPTATSLVSPVDQRRDASEVERRKDVDASKRKENEAHVSATVSPLRTSLSSSNSVAGPLDVVFRSAPKLFISNTNGPTVDSLVDAKGGREGVMATATAVGKDNGPRAREGETEGASRVREIPYVSAASIRITSPSPSPPPTMTSNPVITIYPSSMQPGSRKASLNSAAPAGPASSSPAFPTSPPSTSVSFASMVRHSLNKHTPIAAGTMSPNIVGSSPESPAASTSPSSSSSSPSSPPSSAAVSAPVVHKNPLITIRPSAWSQGPAATAHSKPTAFSSPSAPVAAGAGSATSRSSAASTPSPSDPIWTAVGGGSRRK